MRIEWIDVTHKSLCLAGKCVTKTHLNVKIVTKRFNITRYRRILKYTASLLPNRPSMSFIELYQKSQYLNVCRYHRLAFLRKITGKNLQFASVELLVALRCDLRLMDRRSLARINRLAAKDCGIDLIVSIRNCSDLYVVSIKWSYCSISFVICSIWSGSLSRLPSWETAKNRGWWGEPWATL